MHSQLLFIQYAQANSDHGKVCRLHLVIHNQVSDNQDLNFGNLGMNQKHSFKVLQKKHLTTSTHLRSSAKLVKS